MLKTDLHIHTNEDPKDKWIKYSAKELIDKASDLKYEVLSITLHDSMYYDKEIAKYAESKGILLIPGIEKTIEGKHILLYNFKQEELDQIREIEDIKKFKKENNLVIASHPFFKAGVCIGKKLYEHKGVFDALEYCFFYTKYFNWNKEAVSFSNQYNIPLVSSSDLHRINYLDSYYIEINSKKTVDDVIKGIKKGTFIMKTKPLSTTSLAKMTMHVLMTKIKGKSKR